MKKSFLAPSLDARDYAGNTPLHAAAERGHARIVRYLLGARSAVTAANREMEQPLHLAARQGVAMRRKLKGLGQVGAADSSRAGYVWVGARAFGIIAADGVE